MESLTPTLLNFEISTFDFSKMTPVSTPDFESLFMAAKQHPVTTPGIEFFLNDSEQFKGLESPALRGDEVAFVPTLITVTKSPLSCGSTSNNPFKASLTLIACSAKREISHNETPTFVPDLKRKLDVVACPASLDLEHQDSNTSSELPISLRRTRRKVTSTKHYSEEDEEETEEALAGDSGDEDEDNDEFNDSDEEGEGDDNDDDDDDDEDFEAGSATSSATGARAVKMYASTNEATHDETKLKVKLDKQMKELQACASKMKGLSSAERKKIRNRKASKISRLKKKLSVFDLQRRYEIELQRADELYGIAQAMQGELNRLTQLAKRVEPSCQPRVFALPSMERLPLPDLPDLLRKQRGRPKKASASSSSSATNKNNNKKSKISK